MNVKNLKKLIFFFFILLVGGLGGILADKYVFPYFSTTKFFSKYEFLKKSAENVTIINKTEQVIVKEDTSINKLAGQTIASVVNVISIPNPANPKNVKSEIKNSTGVIVTSDGLIMTGADNILPGSKIKVLLNENESLDATLEGIDTFSNLAFVKINANNLPSLSFGNSDESKPGEKIIAIGNTGKNFSVQYATAILGNFNPYFNLSEKPLSSSDRLEGIFESKFASEKEFVGGPIINYLGEAIGIINVIEKNGTLFFFEIPSNKVKRVIDRAIQKELGKNVILGLNYIPLTKTSALATGNKLENGALISAIQNTEGSAIQKSLLRPNDIILEVNQKKITAEKSLSDIVYELKQGSEITFKIMREEKEMELKFKP